MSFLQKTKASPPSVLIFHGPEGAGKKFAAVQFACELFCSNHQSDCVTCRRVQQNIYPDFILFQSQDASIKVDEIRELIQLNAPIESLYKIIVIDDCENITGEAASCLLKVLEEPVSKLIFILVTNKYNRILSTIKSRSVGVEFYPLPRAEVKKFLTNRKAKEEDAEVLSRVANGSITKALQYYSGGKLALRDQIVKMFSFMLSPSMVLGQINNIKDTESFFDVFKDLVCDLYLLNYDQTLEIVNLDIREQLLSLSRKDFVPKLYNAVRMLNQQKEQIRGSMTYYLKAKILSSLFAA